jgi:hypothetical protein
MIKNNSVHRIDTGIPWLSVNATAFPQSSSTAPIFSGVTTPVARPCRRESSTTTVPIFRLVYSPTRRLFIYSYMLNYIELTFCDKFWPVLSHPRAPLKQNIFRNKIYKFSSYLTENILHLHYKD